MKPLLIAAAVMLLPAMAPSAALAQVAAGSLPNSFDAPASAPRAAAPAAAAAPAIPAASAPAHPRAEEVLREIIAGAQSGAMDYSLMSDDLAARVREQETAIQPLIAGFGMVLAVDFVGKQSGADLFAVTFANAATQWVIGFNEADKVAALLFRPAE